MEKPWKDYTSKMWEWTLAGILRGTDVDFTEPALQQAKALVLDNLSPHWEDMLGKQNRAALAFSLMMNHIGDYPIEDESINDSKAVGPAAEALMFDMPELCRAFQIWIYG